MIDTNRFRPKVLTVGVVGAPQISGDGKTVVWNQLVGDNVDIYRYCDGQIDRISSDPRQDIHPSLNHDGSVITWTRWNKLDPKDPEGNFDVVVWKDGREQTVAETRANESDPVVSPDGAKIAWESDVDGNNRQSVIQCLENGKIRDLTQPSDNAAFPVFGGNQHLFWRSYGADGSDLVRFDGQNAQKITNQPGSEVKPAASKDGQVVFYQKVSDSDDDLFRLDLKTGQTELAAGLKKVDEDWPSTSADGSVLAWTNFDRRLPLPTANTQIYVRENGENRQVTFGPGIHGQTSMSDDGNKIAYHWINSAFINNRAIVLLERQPD
ncbi:PD40 domain-containing protein [bacterium]|nr:PD40 domain-containing protein [bacterium]